LEVLSFIFKELLAKATIFYRVILKQKPNKEFIKEQESLLAKMIYNN
jgi:hypothetical protein